MTYWIKHRAKRQLFDSFGYTDFSLYFIEGDPEDIWVISKKDQISIEVSLLKNI